MGNINFNLSLEKKKQQERKIRAGLFIFVIILFVGFSFLYFLQSTYRTQFYSTLENEDFGKFKESLEKAVLVNNSSIPTVIQIVDIDNLKKQNPLIYAQAKNDDLVLIYPDKTIIFRPSVNKIVSIIPVL